MFACSKLKTSKSYNITNVKLAALAGSYKIKCSVNAEMITISDITLQSFANFLIESDVFLSKYSFSDAII